MALAKMKFVSIIGLIDHLDELITTLGYSGVFHPDDATEFFSETDKFLPISTKNDSAATLSKLKSIMTQSGIEPQIVNVDDYKITTDEMAIKVTDIENELGTALKEKESALLEIRDCNRKIEDSSHFVQLKLEVDKIEACEFIKANFGRLPKDSYNKLSAYEDNEFVQFFPCSSDEKYYWGVYTAPIDEADEIDGIFSALYFEHIDVEGLKGTPTDFIALQKERIKKLSERISQIDKLTNAYLDERTDEILKIYSKLCEIDAFYTIRSYAYRYHNNFILAGWIPAKNEKELSLKLDKIESIDVNMTDAKEEIKHNPPVKYKNNFFSKPFEYYTDMYGTPNYSEIDPSSFIAFTYSLLFGIMFGDVGHGIFLLLAAIVMYKLKGMELGRLLIPCAISSTIFGFVFGSVFGFEHLLDPMYEKLFGFHEKPIEVMESEWTMTIIYTAVGIGMVLVMVAMCLNIYSSIKRKDYGNALFGVNGLSGLVFYASVVIGIVLMLMLDISIMTPMYIIFLIVLPIILVFLREPLSKLIEGDKSWKPEKIGAFIVDNFFELFEVCLSYVTNTMSFLRVGAFVLVHAGMMQVVFVLAEMFG
ncbi:MAG: V-type ATPase 116kDa subunit family protein, partial [Eubacteriales bacterium]|nr:V-type ATPase 116kDa subunit family protein [Eubacteriales bacterium]